MGTMRTLMLILMTAIVTGCATDEESTMMPSRALPMCLEGGLTAFDGTATRASAWTWQDGATLYLQFQNGSSTVSGRAVYSKSTSAWTVSDFSGTIGSSGQCEVYFFDGASTTDQTAITLGSGVGVYADKSGSYAYNGSVVTVMATLSPQISRVLFQAPAGTTLSSVTVEGITNYASYNISTNTFTTSSSAITTTVNTSTGATDYVYGTFTDSSTRQMTLTNNLDGDNILFSRSFGSNVLQTGKSGILTIPTKANKLSWTMQDHTPVEIEAVDLGLPSGTLWANMNVGASKPEDYGDYFAWGETEPKNDYSWSTYKWCNGSQETCIDIGSDISGTEYDVAHLQWGDSWCMPTLSQLKELQENCTTMWTVKDGNIGGVVITSKINGKSIFMPAGGYYNGTTLTEKETNTFCHYWFSTMGKESYNAVYAQFSGRSFGGYSEWFRCHGRLIRPVQGEVDSNEVYEINMSDFGLSNGTQVTTLTAGDGTTLTFSQGDGKNQPAYYTATLGVRMYALNSLTITSPKEFSKVVVTVQSYNGTIYNGNETMYGEADGERADVNKDSEDHVTFSGFNSKTLKIVNDYEYTTGGTQLRVVKLTLYYGQNAGDNTRETRTFTVMGNGKTVTFNMKLVEAGTFQMGCGDSETRGSEKPVHQVTLTNDY